MTRVVWITGASSGFGKGAAASLLDTGDWTVYAGARRVADMEDLAEKGAHVLELDVTSDTSVEAAAGAILDAEGRIDGLLANAGYGSYGMVEAVPLEEIRHQFEVNVFGVARCLKAVLPGMRERRSGRIVITESLVSRLSFAGLGWYAATKHALRAMSTALRQEVRGLGIDVVAIEPGGVSTGFGEVAFARLDAVDHAPDYRELSGDFHAFMADAYAKAPGPQGTVAAMVEALTAARPKPVYRTTPDSRFGAAAAGMVTEAAYDRIMLGALERAGKKARRS